MGDIKVRPNYCIRGPGILKWIQLIFAAVILGLILYDVAKEHTKNKTDFEEAQKKIEDAIKDNDDILDGYVIKGEQYTILVACLCIIMNLLLLIIFFLSCHSGPCVTCPCFSLAAIYYGASFLIWLAAGGVEVFAAIQYRDDSQKLKNVFSKEDLEELFGRRAAAAAFCFANALLYLASLQQAKYQDL